LTFSRKGFTGEYMSQPLVTPDHVVRRIAVAASAHPRTVRRVIDGRPTKAMTRERIEKALREAGIAFADEYRDPS
jgi:hypothetical protein